MSSRFWTKRFRRSLSSRMVCTSCARSAVDSAPSQLARPVAEPMIETSGVRRSCETDESSAERSRSVSVSRRASSMSVARLVRSIATATWSTSASSRCRCSGVSCRLGFSNETPSRPCGPRPVLSGRNSHSERRQRARAPAGRLVVLPGPVRGAPGGRRHLIFGRIAGCDLEPVTVLRQQHQRMALQGRGDVMHCRPQHVVERSGAGDPAAEVVEVGRAPGGQAHGLDLRLEPRRQVADDHRDHEEEDDRQHVLAALDDEGVVRLGEEEVVGDEAQQARVDRRPQAEADRGEQNRHQKDQRQVGERQEAIRHMGDSRSRRPRPASPSRRRAGPA